MSTTSCPHCSAIVTLPVGVSNETTVRCPLCHAHYALADAFISMPPLLEVVDEFDEELLGDAPAREASDISPLAGLSLPEDDHGVAETLELSDLTDDESSDEKSLEALDLQDESAADELVPMDAEPAGDETLADGLSHPTVDEFDLGEVDKAPVDEAISFDEPDEKNAVAADDLESLDFTAEPAPEAQADDADELALDFGGDELTAADATAETIEFGSAELAGEAAEEEVRFDLLGEANDADMTLEFGEPLGEAPAADEEVKFDFEDAVDDQAETVQFSEPLEGVGEVEFNFEDAEAPTGEAAELRPFDDLRVEPAEHAEDVPVDLPVAALAPVEPATGDAADGKRSKKKTKKEKPAKSADGKKSRSLAGSLVSVLVPTILAVPLALYGALWISKDYDFLGLGGMLPGAMLPAEYSTKGTQVAQYVPPAIPPSAAPAGMAPVVPADDDEADAAATEHVTERPADEPADTDTAADEMPAEDAPVDQVADDPFAPAPSDTAAAAADEGDDLFAPTDSDAAMAADAPAEADDPFAPADADDPFAPAPADVAMPADDAVEDDPFAPAPAADALVDDDDPFAPAPARPAMPAEEPGEDDPFTPAPAADAADDDPFAPAPAEDAAEDDPFAPAPAAEMPADDPFAPAPRESDAEMPADDPFAPAEAPAEPPAADDDLFAPEPAREPAEEMPAADDPFAPAPAEPADDDPFAPAPAAEPEMPADEDPFAPAPAADEPAADDPITRPAAEDPFAPAPVEPAADMPADDPVADDPFAPGPADPAPEPEVMPAPPRDARPAADDVFDVPAAEPLPEPAEEPVVLGPREVAAVSPSDVAGALQATFVAGQEMMAAEVSGDDALLRKARAAFYVNLFGMADAVTSAQQGPSAAVVGDQLQSLAPTLRQQLASDPRRLEALKVFGARWIAFPNRTTNGVVVAGTVESAEQIGKLFHTKARLGSTPEAPVITIVSAQPPEVAAGDTVLALGSVVEDPARQLAGYQGDEPTVVWSGMAMKVAASGN